MNSRDVDQRWWRADKNRVHEAVEAATAAIKTQQQNRKSQHERCLRLYGQDHTFGQSRVTHVYTPGRKVLSLNIVRNIIDTMQAEVCQNRPKPMFITQRGDWSLQRKAKLMEQFTEGLFYETDVYETTPDVYRDACIFDAGVVKVYLPDEDGTKIAVERVLPIEILVDDASALYGRPRVMYQQKWIDRSVLIDIYPGSESDIDAATRTTSGGSWDTITSDLVLVTEAWRLPDGETSGRHVIVIESTTLLDEDYDEEDFPFEFIRWGVFPVGFWGSSLAQELFGLQFELNFTMQRIQEAHHLLGKSHILWPKGCGTPKSHWTNEIGNIIEYNPTSGPPPQAIAVQPVHPDAYNWVETIYRKAHEIRGISQMAAQNQIPAGITGSGEAQRVFEAISSKRFVLQGQAYERLHMGIARKALDLGRKISEKHPDYATTWTGRKSGRVFAKQIAWSDAYVDGYVLKVFPTSILPSNPAGRIATVQEWANAGWIDQTEAKRLMDIPDVESHVDLELASWDIITEYIERMLDAQDPDDPEAYMPPEPYMDLKLALKVTQGAYLRAKLDGCPEGNLELLRRFMSQIVELAGPPPQPEQSQPQPPEQAAPPQVAA